MFPSWIQQYWTNSAIHQNDPNHPVSTAHGEVPATSALNLCPNVDVWGMNVYRWDDPSGAINQFSAISTRPCYLSESGGDRYNASQSHENQQNQADADLAIWNSIKGKLDVCSGITFFSFVDEWWKGGNVNTQDPSGFAMSIPYDSFANEEWWGIVDIYRNTTLAYTALKDVYTEHATFIDDVPLQQCMKLYPNPARDKTVLKLPQSINEPMLLSISGMCGNRIVSGKISVNGDAIEIPLKKYNLQNGCT